MEPCDFHPPRPRPPPRKCVVNCLKVKNVVAPRLPRLPRLPRPPRNTYFFTFCAVFRDDDGDDALSLCAGYRVGGALLPPYPVPRVDAVSLLGDEQGALRWQCETSLCCARYLCGRKTVRFVFVQISGYL